MSGEKAYQNALRRRAELRQELDEIETFLRLYEKYMSLSGAVEAMPDIKDALTVESANGPASRSEDFLDRVAGMGLVPHIRRVILDLGRPQPRASIARALADRGIKVGGQNPITNLGTLMWRAKDEFVNLKPHGYWPRDVAYAPAGYNPAQNAETDDDENGGSSAAAQAEKRESDEGDLWSGERSAA